MLWHKCHAQHQELQPVLPSNGAVSNRHIHAPPSTKGLQVRLCGSVAAQCTNRLCWGVVGVQPQHVHVGVVPETHDQNHSASEGPAHGLAKGTNTSRLVSIRISRSLFMFTMQGKVLCTNHEPSNRRGRRTCCCHRMLASEQCTSCQ